MSFPDADGLCPPPDWRSASKSEELQLSCRFIPEQNIELVRLRKSLDRWAAEVTANGGGEKHLVFKERKSRPALQSRSVRPSHRSERILYGPRPVSIDHGQTLDTQCTKYTSRSEISGRVRRGQRNPLHTQGLASSIPIRLISDNKHSMSREYLTHRQEYPVQHNNPSCHVCPRRKHPNYLQDPRPGGS